MPPRLSRVNASRPIRTVRHRPPASSRRSLISNRQMEPELTRWRPGAERAVSSGRGQWGTSAKRKACPRAHRKHKRRALRNPDQLHPIGRSPSHLTKGSRLQADPGSPIRADLHPCPCLRNRHHLSASAAVPPLKASGWQAGITRPARASRKATDPRVRVPGSFNGLLDRDGPWRIRIKLVHQTLAPAENHALVDRAFVGLLAAGDIRWLLRQDHLAYTI
jgi:hypothetical protein